MNSTIYEDNKITPLKSQTLLLSTLELYPHIGYYYLIGGYGCGKSASIRIFLAYFLKKYEAYPIKYLLCGTTLGDIQKFVLDDFFKLLIMNHIDYKHDKKLNLIYIGKHVIACVPTEEPNRIYGHSVDIALVDEVDELKKDIAELVFKALTERVRENNLPDRDPFQMFFTTTQGKKRGTYLNIKNQKEKNIPHIVVRGRTEDNPYNSPAYIANLKAIYSPEEQEAFMHGKFIDFAAGLVYYDFNAEKCVIPDIEILPHDDIFVGQDKNIGYNKSVCKVKRDGKLITVGVLSVGKIGETPIALRLKYPTQNIYWYPDASSNELIQMLAGYSQEFQKLGIIIKPASYNPNILARIFAVNKMYKTGRSLVCKSCKELIDAHDARGFNDLGMPEKPGGEKCYSHVCDADEYVTWRLVMEDPDFRDLRAFAEKM